MRNDRQMQEAASMDEREAELMREIQLRRADLVNKAEAFRRTVVTNFDPREKVRKHPIGGTVTSLLAGVALALASTRRPDHQARAGIDGMAKAFLPGLLRSLVPSVLVGLIDPLLSQIGRGNKS